MTSPSAPEAPRPDHSRCPETGWASACIDHDDDGVCDRCHVALETCFACDGVGYHRDDCEEIG